MILNRLKAKTYLGFTLAEIIIVIGIIGVIAQMTIPSLINKTNRLQYIVALKKSYAAINQAVVSTANSEGCINDLACTGLFASGINSTEMFGDEFVKNLKVLKNCRQHDKEGCFSNKVSAFYDGIGRYSDYDNFNLYRFILVDGSSYAIRSAAQDEPDCGAANVWLTGPESRTCAYLMMDVNGPQKGPNSEGRDIFTFLVTNTRGAGLFPYGASTGNYPWQRDGVPESCTPENPIGGYCAGRVIEEGWQMNYENPADPNSIQREQPN